MTIGYSTAPSFLSQVSAVICATGNTTCTHRKQPVSLLLTGEELATGDSTVYNNHNTTPQQQTNSLTIHQFFVLYLHIHTRFINTPAVGKVWAKTGSMSGVSSLSGYVINERFAEQFLLFSIIVNGNPHAGSVATAGIDDLVVFLAEALPC